MTARHDYITRLKDAYTNLAEVSDLVGLDEHLSKKYAREIEDAAQQTMRHIEQLRELMLHTMRHIEQLRELILKGPH